MLAIISIPISKESVKQFRFWMMLLPLFTSFGLLPVLYFTSTDLWRSGRDQGVFLRQELVITGGAVALTAALYFLLHSNLSICSVHL